MRLRLFSVAVCVLPLTTGCVKELSSEERLERELASSPARQEISKADLVKLHCQDAPDELARARDENRPETDRLLAYFDLFEALKKKVSTYEEAMTRNPDLHYQEGSEELVAARDLCIQQVADVRLEFESYVRELVTVPTVQEIKGGTTITVPRLDFNTLRQAIDSLNPDDKDLLLNRVAAAEKKVSAAEAREAPASSSSSSRRRR